MKQVEITSRILSPLNEQIEKLKQQGFIISKKGRVEDEYLSQSSDKVTRTNILNQLSHCVLLRYLKENNHICSQITYKNKEYINDEVISEEKYSIPCSDLAQARKLFIALGFKTFIHVKYDVIEMKKEDFHFAFQDVEGLGTLVECESQDDFSKASLTEIAEEKQKLWNKLHALGLNISADLDVKKAKELILKNKNCCL